MTRIARGRIIPPDSFAELVSNELLPDLTTNNGIVSAQYWQGDPEQTNVSSTERGLRRPRCWNSALSPSSHTSWWGSSETFG